MRNSWKKAGLLLAATTFAPWAMASGYSIYEQDSEATAQAGAVIARADNASANYYNPAGLATQEGTSISIGGTLIRYGAWGQLNKDVNLVYRGGATPVIYRQYLAGTRTDLETRNFFPMHAFINYKLKPNMAIGFGAYAPFGLGTTWNDRNNSPFKYMAENVDIRVSDMSPSFAMSHLDGKIAWSIGADYYHATATLDQAFDLRQKSVYSGSPFAPGLLFPGGDNFAHLEAEGNKLGWHIGLQFAPNKAWKIGLVYRTKAEIELEGNASYSLVSGNAYGCAIPNPNTFPCGFPGGMPGSVPLSALFPAQAAKTMLPIPATGGVGAAWMGDKWEVELDASYQGWSAFKSLDLDFSNNTCLTVYNPPGSPTPTRCVPILTDRHIREDWKNTWAYRLGTKWKAWDSGYVGFGVLHDSNPVPDETVRSLLPDGDRFGLTTGVGTMVRKIKLDFSIMYLGFEERTSNPPAAVNGDPNSATFGQALGAGITEHETLETISASYRANVWLFGFNLGYKW